MSISTIVETILTLSTSKRKNSICIFALISSITFVCFLAIIVEQKLRKSTCFRLKITIAILLIKSF